VEIRHEKGRFSQLAWGLIEKDLKTDGGFVGTFEIPIDHDAFAVGVNHIAIEVRPITLLTEREPQMKVQISPRPVLEFPDGGNPVVLKPVSPEG
jgi:hypothetical protein